eukprot:gene3242-6415_t
MGLSNRNVQNLPDDLSLRVLSFCSPNDLALVEATCRHFLNIPMSRILWAKHCSVKWGIPYIEILSLEYRKVCFRKLYPIAWPICNNLISLEDDIKILDNSAVFTGIVGRGNRSVQCMIPFPTTRNMRKASILSVLLWKVFLKLSSVYHSSTRTNDQSCPFYDRASQQLILASRTVSYYEVTIRKTNPKISIISGLAHLYTTDDALSSDCIAVGLATRDFHTDKRLPGWDNQSFGYHSDDGAIFHGGGRALAAYGPKFSSGDVIGCGMNFATRTIFFTLNGTYLGDAFCNVSDGLTLYPTVGIDANVTLHFNFGKESFMFPFLEYLNS